MRRHLWTIAAGAFLISFNMATAEVRCKCPKIEAQGVGDSSCSASETDGNCTVDFNLFGPVREGRAVKLLAKAFPNGLSAPDPNLDSVEALERANGDQGIDFVLVYLTVGIADAVAAGQVKQDSVEEALRNLSLARREPGGIGDAIREMFSTQQASFWSGPSNPSSTDIRTREVSLGFSAKARLSPGCVEVTTGSVWMMFKARWAQARLAPQCGPNR